MNVIEEKKLNRYCAPISYDSTEKILSQMKMSVCKIKSDKGIKGTGFFCKIPFPDSKNLLPVLITNNHIINKEELDKKNSSILIFMKNLEKPKEIKLNNRINYTSKIYDTTIIEINPDKDGINVFLELDENIILDEPNKFYLNESIYIMHYPDENLSVSYGILNNIFIYDNNQFKFSHYTDKRRFFWSTNNKFIKWENNWDSSRCKYKS